MQALDRLRRRRPLSRATDIQTEAIRTVAGCAISTGPALGYETSALVAKKAAVQL
jgi:hypothetical protein